MEVPAHNFSHIVHRSLVLLDGGLGTTLEDCIGVDISQSPLWSALPIVQTQENEAILKAHLLFLRAGSRILSTSTYQCSFETFQAAGYDSEQAKIFMRQSVRIANQARLIYQDETRKEDIRDGLSETVLIALSLGPYGATLKPTQEFRGFYSPPFGPREYKESHTNTNAFNKCEIGLEDIAIDALTKFHYNRLLVYASDPETWNAIDCLAFETVPLKREITAIRNALQLLQEFMTQENRGLRLKPWWISCVFPEGESPGETVPGGSKIQIEELLAAAFSAGADDAKRSLASPSGFGINCTKPQYLSTLAASVGRFFKTFPVGDRPWLVLYPNGNDTYDEETRSWIVATDQSDGEWAEEVADTVTDLLQVTDDAFGGIIVGGCCKTGPSHISALRSKLEHYRNHEDSLEGKAMERTC